MAPTKDTFGKFKSGKRIKVRCSAADLKRIEALSLYLSVSMNEVIRRGVYTLHEFCEFEKSLAQRRGKSERGYGK